MMTQRPLSILFALTLLLSACSNEPESHPGPVSGPELNDEFNQTNSLTGEGNSEWQILNPAKAGTIDINSTASGKLVIIPLQEPKNGWYQSHQGPFVYKPVSGNFAVSAQLKVVSSTDPDNAPSTGFNSGGIMVRDPRSNTGSENWVMYNMGAQNDKPELTATSGYGREIKTTIKSSSSLKLFPQANFKQQLLVCRIKNKVYYFHRESDNDTWTEETINHRRSDFGNTLQVGLITNAWSGALDTRLEVDYIRFGLPATKTECTTSL